MIKTNIVSRIAALAVIVSGLLLGVLSPAGTDSNNWRWLGLGLLIIGVMWLISQRQAPIAERQPEPYQAPVMKWYQSPILWVPIIIAVVAILSLLL
jgi:MFS family permease